MDLPSLSSHVVISYQVRSLLILVGAWSLLCGCIGFLIGHRPRPARLVFLPESHRKLYESQPDLRTGTSR